MTASPSAHSRACRAAAAHTGWACVLHGCHLRQPSLFSARFWRVSQSTPHSRRHLVKLMAAATHTGSVCSTAVLLGRPATWLCAGLVGCSSASEVLVADANAAPAHSWHTAGYGGLHLLLQGAHVSGTAARLEFAASSCAQGWRGATADFRCCLSGCKTPARQSALNGWCCSCPVLPSEGWDSQFLMQGDRLCFTAAQHACGRWKGWVTLSLRADVQELVRPLKGWPDHQVCMHTACRSATSQA